MPVTDCPIVGYYDQQRFKQFNPSDAANWYLTPSDIGKKKVAMYPCMGRKHINFLNQNRLIFDQEPRAIYKSVNYWYSIVGNRIFRIDQFYNQIEITATTKINSSAGNIFFTYLVAGTNGSTPDASAITFVCFADGQNLWIYREDTGAFGAVTDSNMPIRPLYLATFGNRIVVSTANSNLFGLSEINLGGSSFNLSTCFTINSAAVFSTEISNIGQMAVLENTLYIMCDYTTGVWSNIPSTFISAGGTTTTFPFKKNTTYDWDFGIGDPNSLDIDFGMIAFLARNRNGLIQPMVSISGQKPEKISSKAIDVKLQQITNFEGMNPFLTLNADGFLYEYEDTIFYRFSAGMYDNTELVDEVSNSISFEYNFDTQKWTRAIELNGQRNRIQDHIFFANKHLVTVEGDSTVYEMSGRFYTNDITNPAHADDPTTDAYLIEPFRYERITPIICAGLIDALVKLGAAFYDDFITDFVEIDFIWGDSTFILSDAPFDNAVFIIDEEKASDGTPQFLVNEENENQFIIAENSNFPVPNSPTYWNWFKPHVELLYSDNGGITFTSADVLQFSDLGVYQWRMRWYNLGTSRNRVYKLICVSPAPIVVLGAQMSVRRASGGTA